jgi:hypothetical protein
VSSILSCLSVLTGSVICRDMEAEHAAGIAEGRLHPETKAILEDLWPEHDPSAIARNRSGPVSVLGTQQLPEGSY